MTRKDSTANRPFYEDSLKDILGSEWVAAQQQYLPVPEGLKVSKKEGTPTEKIKPVTRLSITDYKKHEFIETLWQRGKGWEALFAIKREDGIHIQPTITDDKGQVWKPMDLRGKANIYLWLPSGIVDYVSQDELIKRIMAYIATYLNISDADRERFAHYVLMTWVYRNFDSVPYLHFIGDKGSAKTRALQVIGSICYKGTLISGSVSGSGIFRIQDELCGTLCLDEGDWEGSYKDTSDVIKILNQGYKKGLVVIRADKPGFATSSYQVYGPKIVTTRGTFNDALESRCLTTQFVKTQIPRGIPLQLGPDFYTQAKFLRNQLLKWRFDNLQKVRLDAAPISEAVYDGSIEARLGEVCYPLYSVARDEGFKQRLLDYIKAYNEEQKSKGRRTFVIRALWHCHNDPGIPKPLLMSALANWTQLHAETYAEFPVSPQAIGQMLKGLGLEVAHTKRGTVVVQNAKYAELLPQWAKEYGLGDSAVAQPVPSSDEQPTQPAETPKPTVSAEKQATSSDEPSKPKLRISLKEVDQLLKPSLDPLKAAMHNVTGSTCAGCGASVPEEGDLCPSCEKIMAETEAKARGG